MIRGERVVLRPVEEQDYEDIKRWQNEPDVFAAMDYEQPFSLDDIRDSEARARLDGYPFIIEVDGRGIGRIGLNQIRRRDRIASLYVFIGEKALWGNGFGSDAITALLAYAFERLDLHQVELWGLEGNDRAFGAYAKCGFVHEATLRDRAFHDGRFIARVLMSVTREEFDASRAG